MIVYWLIEIPDTIFFGVAKDTVKFELSSENLYEVIHNFHFKKTGNELRRYNVDHN